MRLKKASLLLIAALTGCVEISPPMKGPSASGDAQFARLSEEFISSYLTWRPQAGTALGLHEYDGKITDLSRESIDGELARLRDFQRSLAAISTASLSPPSLYDYLIL